MPPQFGLCRLLDRLCDIGRHVGDDADLAGHGGAHGFHHRQEDDLARLEAGQMVQRLAREVRAIKRDQGLCIHGLPFSW